MAGWHAARVAAYEAVLVERQGTAAFLVWGDPAFYDSTIRIIEAIAERGAVEVDYDVVPGISALQLLAARHRIVLHDIGQPLHVTTGRLLADAIAAGQTNIAVMLNRSVELAGLEDWAIWWGGNLGRPEEELISGRVGDVLAEIEAARDRIRRERRLGARHLRGPAVSALVSRLASLAPQPAAALLVAGMTSDAGKSVVVTGLCRALSRRGIAVAPFKAQNMSNNSMVVVSVADGAAGEIGRAQWVQALAAGVTPEVAMNPVLLKPGSDRRSHVVRMGQPDGEISARDFTTGRERLAESAFAAFDDLRSRFEVVVAEGAGSPAEINLRASDYVNMGLARHGDLPTIVVGDIDRGGWFASAYGTLMLLDEADRALMKGYVVNKFRGDVDLLRPGLADLEARTGRPTYGVLPWHPDLWLDSEDALDLEGRRSLDGARKVAVVRLPRISNFTDVDALGLEPGLDVGLRVRPGAAGGR